VLPAAGAAARPAAGEDPLERLERGDCLALRHDAPWPLCLVVAPQDLDGYSEAFSALLRARRVRRQLDALWGQVCARQRGGGAGAGGGGPGGRRGGGSGTTRGGGGGGGGDYDGGGGDASGPQAAARLRALRLHVQAASHCARAAGAFMHEQLLGGLAEGLARRLESAPATVAEMRAAHAAALARARRFCLLPAARGAAGGGAGGLEQPRKQQDEEREPPWAAPLALEINGLLACCWRLQAFAAGGTCGGGGSGGGQEGLHCLGSDAAWAPVAAAGGELSQRLGRCRERLSAAAMSEPEWQGLLARLG
jgi:hypothetical protein